MEFYEISMNGRNDKLDLVFKLLKSIWQKLQLNDYSELNFVFTLMRDPFF